MVLQKPGSDDPEIVVSDEYDDHGGIGSTLECHRALWTIVGAEVIELDTPEGHAVIEQLTCVPAEVPSPDTASL